MKQILEMITVRVWPWIKWENNIEKKEIMRGKTMVEMRSNEKFK